MAPQRLILFDLDGTLLDTGRGVVKCIATTLARMGFEVPDENTCRSFVGPPLKKRFLELYKASVDTADAVMRAFREEYGKGDVFLADRYEGMEEVLAHLHSKFTLAVATYKREDHATRLLEKFGLAHFFDTICGSDAAATMTKKQIAENAMRQLGASSADCILVGDSNNDAECAAELGITFVAATYGYGFKSEMDAAAFPHAGCARNPSELVEIIECAAKGIPALNPKCEIRRYK